MLSPGVNQGDTLSYIDLFAYAVRHEQAHHRNFVLASWGLSTYDSAWDWDQDYLPDPDEFGLEEGPYSPMMMDTYLSDGYLNDCERHNPNSQYAIWWDTGSADNEDWAKPGKKYNQAE